MNYRLVNQVVKSIITPPVFADKERTQSARWFLPSLVVLLFVLLIASLAIPTAEWQDPIHSPIALANSVGIVFILFALLVVRLGYLKTAAFIVLMTLYSVATYLNIVTFQTIRSPDIMVYFVVIPLAGLLLGKLPMVWFSLLCFLTVLATYYLEWFRYIVPYSGESATSDNLVVLLLGIILNTIFLYSAIGRSEEKAEDARQSAAELTEANRELAANQAELQQARAELEVRVARRTQELSLANTQLQAEIEERQRLLDALRKSEANWRSLVTNAPEIVMTIDTNGIVTFINRTADHQTPEAVVGTNAANLYAQPKYQALFKECMQHVLQTGKTVTYESVRESGEQSLWHLNRLGTIQRDNSIEALILIATDITEQKQTEAAMHRMQKMESLGVLAGGVAHDFNNLLTAMSGQQSLALLKLPPDDPRRRYLQQTMKAIERATELTRQMLNYAGRGKSEQKMIQLNDLVTDNIHLFSASISKNISLSTALANTLPLLYGDQGQLQQLIMNLILNSADAIGEEAGEVKIKTRLYQLNANESLQWTWTGELLTPGAYILLEVQDTGCGMDADTLGKIFDPFFTTKFTGRGLGLASVLGIVRSHQGGLRIESTPGIGTTFFILLPVAEQAATLSDTVAPASALAMQGELVLLIDDEKSICETTAEILTTAGLNVIAAYNGRTGLAAFYKQHAAIRLVLLDLSMPEMNGETVLQELRKVKPFLPVILTSGYDEYEVMNRVQGEAALSFVQKPYTIDTLLQAVQQQLQHNVQADTTPAIIEQI